MARAGDHDRGRELAHPAEQIARCITAADWRARKLAAAEAVARDGDHDRAEQVARSPYLREQADAMAEVARRWPGRRP